MIEQNIAFALSLVTMTGALSYAITTRRRLNALRRNCYLTDEKGHRRKWADCSDAVRDRADG